MKAIIKKLLQRFGLDEYVYVHELKTDEDGKRLKKMGMTRWQFRSQKSNKVLYTSYADNDLWFVTPRSQADKSYVKQLADNHIAVVITGVERAKKGQA
tara:strand:- start:5023 stop:5316 length:294 start_codon:yes stop_codon:yes gene_type:complete